MYKRQEKTVFQKQEIELNNTLEEAFDICLSDEKVENLNEGTTVGTFTVNEMAPEGNYVFSLCTGEGDTHNPYFAIENGVLKTAKKLEEGKTYQVAISGISEKLASETEVTDSGIVGLDAAKDFLGKFKTLSEADAEWK